MRIFMHNNYVEPHGTAQDAIHLAWQLGLSGVEFRTKVLDSPQADNVMVLNQARSLSPPIWNATFDLVNRPDESINDLKRTIPTAAAAGITLINLTTTVVQNDNAQTHDLDRHGSAAANETQWDKLVTGLRQAIDVAAEHGIRISLEIHGKYIHDTAQSTLRVIERVGRDTLGITLDPGNMVLLSREMPVEDAVDVIGERMFHIHLKNVQLFKRSPAYRVCLLEEGDVHIPRLLELLFKRGYRGDFTIESTLRGDRYWALKRDAAYIRLVHGRIERIVTKLVKPGNITQ